MPLTLHANYQFGSYLADRTQRLQTEENPDLKRLPNDPKGLRPHFDGNNSLALGYGFDLLVRGNAEILARLSSAGLSDAAVGWVNGPDGTAADKKAHDLNLLDIYRQSRSGLSTPEWQNRAGKLFLTLPSEAKATDLLNVLAADAEAKLTQALFSRGIQINDSRERLALVSMVFNGGLGIFGSSLQDSNLLDALQAGNRVEAWYEIRYRSNKEAIQGIADRRAAESDLFGLYNAVNGQIPTSELEARQVLGFLRQPNIEEKITIDDVKYHRNPGGVTQGSGLDRYLQPAESLLKALFYSSAAHVFVGPGGDPIQGTNENDLLLGGISHDILIGGGGDDVLRGELGKDLYVIGSGDGNDTIVDTAADLNGDGLPDGDGLGVVVLDQHLAQGGIRRQGQPTYATVDEEITYQWDGTPGSDLTITGAGSTVTVKDFTNGKFGIQLTTLPAALVENPERPGVGRSEYLRIDHYVQVGNHPITRWFVGSGVSIDLLSGRIRSQRTERRKRYQGASARTIVWRRCRPSMVWFTTQTGLTWDQAIDQRPQDVQAVLTASWQ